MKNVKVSAQGFGRFCRGARRGLPIAHVLLLAVLAVRTWGQTSVGTHFTYQGQLEQSGNPANGSFDIEFNLYDGADPATATLVGTTTKCAVAVGGGLFTVELAFGDVFLGEARWLEVGVARDGSCDGSTTYTYLIPLQPLTAVPYALFALNGNEGPQGPQGDPGDPGLQGEPGPQGPPGDSHWFLNGSATYYNDGNVGIGTEAPSEKLEVAGTVKATAFVGDGSGLTGISSGHPTVTEPTAYTPAFLTCGINSEQNPVQWSFVTSGRFRVTLDGVAYDVDVNFTGVGTMVDVVLRIQDAIRATTLSGEIVIWDTDHFVIVSGDTTATSSVSELSTHSSALGIDISGSGPGDWMDCDPGNGVVTSAIPNPSFYDGYLVLLNSSGEFDPRFMSQNLQEADAFFEATNITPAQANNLINGTNADALHIHVPAVTAGSTSGQNLVVGPNDGAGTHTLDVPVGFPGATRFKMYYHMSVYDSGGSGWYGKRRGLIEGKLGGATLDIAGVYVDTTNNITPEIGWGDTEVLGYEVVDINLPSVSLDGSSFSFKISVTAVVAAGNNVRIILDVSNVPVGRNWSALFGVRGLIAYK